MSLRASILKWLTAEPRVSNKLRSDTITADYDDLGSKDSSINFRIMKAMNGKVIEITTFKMNNMGRDRQVELYLVPETQNMTEAITHVLAIKALEK